MAVGIGAVAAGSTRRLLGCGVGRAWGAVGCVRRAGFLHPMGRFFGGGRARFQRAVIGESAGLEHCLFFMAVLGRIWRRPADWKIKRR